MGEKIIQGFSKSVIQGADRSASFGCRDFLFAVNRYFYGCMGRAGLVFVFFYGHPERFQLEQWLELIGQFFQQNLERSVGHIKLIALLFHALDFRDDFLPIRPIQLNPEFPGLVFHIAFAGKIGNQHLALVSDQARVNVFIRPGKFHDRTHMNPALMSKCAFSHKRHGALRNHVGGFADEPGQFLQP